MSKAHKQHRVTDRLFGATEGLMPNKVRHLHDEQRKMEAAVENRWMKAVCTCDSVVKKKTRKKMPVK